MLVHNINPIQTFISHKANNTNSDKYKYIAEKKAYIDAKTETLEELSILSFLGAVISGGFNIDTVMKEKKLNKLSVGLIVTSAVLMIAKWIKQIQLSREYDREVKNDSKNFTDN